MVKAKAQDKHTKLRNSCIAINAILALPFIWALYVNLNDPYGLSLMFTFPIYIAVICLLIFDMIVFVALARQVPKEDRKLKNLYLLVALLSITPLVLGIIYFSLDRWLRQAANDRAETAISLQEAERLINSCRVETISRYPDAGGMTLRETIPTLPPGKAYHETRRFNLDLFDGIRILTQSKDTQTRCGFVPVYDITRAWQPEIKKWITMSEAESLISTCEWSTTLFTSSPYPRELLPAGSNTGILLSQHMGPWNNDVISSITLVETDEITKASLQEKMKSCK